MDAKEIIEVGIGSLGKVKIIKALAEESKMSTVYLLHKKTHLKREDIKNNLDDLIRIGWVRQSKYANTVYSINRDNQFVMGFIAYLKEAGYF
jgi:hypothetical protein